MLLMSPIGDNWSMTEWRKYEVKVDQASPLSQTSVIQLLSNRR